MRSISWKEYCNIATLLDKLSPHWLAYYWPRPGDRRTIHYIDWAEWLTSDYDPSFPLYRLCDPIVRSAAVQPPSRSEREDVAATRSALSPHLVMFAITILSGWLESLVRCFPVSYFLHDMVGAGFPVASQIIVRSSPAVTSSVLSHEWIYGGTEQQIISFQSKNYILLENKHCIEFSIQTLHESLLLRYILFVTN